MSDNTDFNDLRDPALIQKCIAQAQPVAPASDVLLEHATNVFTISPVITSADAGNPVSDPETITLAIKRLAAIDTVQYEQVRTKEAKTWNIRVSTLDAEVEKARLHLRGVDAGKISEVAAIEAIDNEEDQAARHNGVPPNYFVTKEGVFWRNPATIEKPNPERLFVCSELRITALVRDSASENWGRVLEFPDADGVLHTSVMPMSMASGDGMELRKELAQQGLEIAPSQRARQHLVAYINGCKPAARGRCVQKTGWYQSVFVLPDHTLGSCNEQVLYQSEKVTRHYTQAGTLGEWQQQVARLCVENSRLVLSICAAFAAPLLAFVGQDSGGFHFVGASSIGKTTLLGVGASVFGAPSYIQTWRATGNGLEGLAAMHNDTLLVLDEMGELDPKEAGSIAYMIGNGTGKARSDRQGDTRARKTWRLLFLSSGEVGLAQHMTEGGKTARAGQEVRLIDVPADAGAGHGAFEELHMFESGGQLANALKEATRHYHGTAALAFIEALTNDIAQIAHQVKEAVAGFIAEHQPEDAGGQATRVCARFGIVAVAGELATHYGVTGWEPGAAKKAAAICFKSWLDQRGGAGNSERTSILAAVRAFFETNGAARFADISTIHDHAMINRAGFRESVNGQYEYYVLPEAYKRDVCANFNPRTVTQVLLDAGWLQPGKDGKSSQKKSLPGMGETRVYKFTAKIWKDGDVD